VTSAESCDDSILNLSRPTTKEFSFLFSQEEKISKFVFLLGIFTRRKIFSFNLSNKICFSGSKKNTVVLLTS